MYLIAVTDKTGVLLLGSVGSDYPINVTIAPAQIGNLSTNGSVIFSANNTKLEGFHNIFLPGSTGYGITISNQSGQNNTVRLTLLITDANAYAGQG